MERARNISKSMMSYLKRAREHKEFLLKETKEFERGKRHLANIMGIESQEMTQDDIDKAIKYLFPASLFDRRAAPMMKHPDIIFKARKEAQFNSQGRPNHFLFYTGYPNYHEALHELSGHLRRLNEYEDRQLANGIIDPPEDANYDMGGRKWLSSSQVSLKFLEKISTAQYDYLIRCLTHLQQHPYASRAKSFIDLYSKELRGMSSSLYLPEIIRDDTSGQIYADVEAKHRTLVLKVKTVLNGTGKIDIEGKDILYFDVPYMRRAILFPLQLSGLLDKVDIIARIKRQPLKLGPGSMAVAIREGVSKSVAAYVDEGVRERMRLAGLLTHDARTRERKKFGQAKARAKYTWKKR